MLDKIKNNEFNVKNLIKSDEAHLHLMGAVNKQNCHYWASLSDNPHNIYEKPLLLYGLVLQNGR